MSKSSLSITRRIGDFKQELWFAKRKYNTGNEVVSFDPHFSVFSTFYARWHKKKYGENPINNSILGTRAHYIPNWDHKYFHDWWYDLAVDDNKEIVKVLKSNIENNGLPYLNTLCDKRNAIEFIMANKFYYKAPMLFDFALMLEDITLANRILTWVNDFFQSTNKEFNERTLTDISVRKKTIKNWA